MRRNKGKYRIHKAVMAKSRINRPKGSENDLTLGIIISTVQQLYIQNEPRGNNMTEYGLPAWCLPHLAKLS